MSKIKKLAGETALYGLGSIVPRALNFLLVPLHTRLFAPEQYGIITNLLAFVSFINIIYMFGMETAFFRFATATNADQKKIFNLAQTVVLVISMTLSVVFITLAQPLANALHVGNHPDFIIWLSCVMLIDAAVAIPFARLRLKRQPVKFASAKILNIVIVIALNFYFLKINYNPSIGVGYVFLATLIANLFYLFFFINDLISWRPIFERKISGAMFTYAYPIMLTGLAGMTNEMFSRLTLEWWLPKDFYGEKSQAYALGVFGACYKYAVLMSVAIQAFRFAAEPFFFSNAADKNSPGLFARVNHYFVIVCCAILLGVSINMDIFKYFTGGVDYWEGLHIVPILLLGYLFLGMYYNFSVWFKITDKTYWGTIITVFGALLTILLNFLLIPQFGYTGSSWATMLVYLIMAITCYLVGQRYFPIPYRLFADFGYVLATCLIIFLVSKTPIENRWISIGFHQVVFLSFACTAYFVEVRWASSAPEQSHNT